MPAGTNKGSWFMRIGFGLVLGLGVGLGSELGDIKVKVLSTGGV